MRARCLATSVWIDGAFIEDPAALVTLPAESRAGSRAGSRAEIPTELLLDGARIPRTDRVTRVASVALARALRSLELDTPRDTHAVITASTLATAHTNERYELRRVEGRPPEPRAFPYTAPNAAGGELAIALSARGPSLALVGGGEVALAALHRACAWLAQGECTRAFVVVVECPPEHSARVAFGEHALREGAVAWVLGPEHAHIHHGCESIEVSISSRGLSEVSANETPALSLEAAARFALGAHVRVVPHAGCAWEGRWIARDA